MRTLIGLCAVLLFSVSGCTAEAFGPTPMKHVAREAANATRGVCREAASRAHNRVSASLPHDFGFTSDASVAGFLKLLRDQTTIDELAQTKAKLATREVVRLSKQWKKAQPALQRAMKTTAKVELKAASGVLCTAVAKLPVAAGSHC